ncbi:hypothetical protein BY458DRAFT_489277 [Sporodiniella umbellata]|nr:hypothetical protein BY458DRAFT_489277 [Sporodiniella umbellata]
MSQDSKEWIKSRMNVLKKQAGFAFDHDLFISILLCLISGKDKHLLLTAPPGRIKEVSHLTLQICKGLFGLTTSLAPCRKGQSQEEFVNILFSSKEDPEGFYTKFSQQKNKGYNTIESESSQSNKNTTLKETGSNRERQEEDFSFTTPISPIDFTLRKTKAVGVLSSSNNRRRIEAEEIKRSTPSTRIVQALIMEELDKSEELVQAILLDLMVSKELKLSSVRYNVPRPFFLIVAVLPHDFNRSAVNSQLVTVCFRTPLEAEKAKKVHVHIDISRYVRDIVVGIRTHPRVKGGVTAKSSQDLVTVTKSLAALFERTFLTPDLVTIATEKVFSHRLRILAINERDDQMQREDMDSNFAFDIVAEILHIVNVPI